MKGTLTSLCFIYKHGSRDVLLASANDISTCLESIQSDRITSNALLRKLIMKLYQRVGLIYLKPKVASWRYKRGTLSLADYTRLTI